MGVVRLFCVQLGVRVRVFSYKIPVIWWRTQPFTQSLAKQSNKRRAQSSQLQLVVLRSVCVWGGGAKDTSCQFTHESTLLVCKLLFKGAIFFSITSKTGRLWTFSATQAKCVFFSLFFSPFMVILAKKETPKGAICFQLFLFFLLYMVFGSWMQLSGQCFYTFSLQLKGFCSFHVVLLILKNKYTHSAALLFNCQYHPQLEKGTASLSIISFKKHIFMFTAGSLQWIREFNFIWVTWKKDHFLFFSFNRPK